MNVENPELAVTRVPKAVEHSHRNRYPRSGIGAHNLIPKRELSLAFEDIKGIHVVPMRMRVHAKSRAKAALDHLQFR